MKRILFSLLIAFSIVIMGACADEAIQTEQPVATSTTLPPSATSTSTITPTALPTPIFTIDLSEYDPDIFPAGVVEHEQPPLIARADETVMLAFWLSGMIYCEELQRDCRVDPLLYYSYGEVESFQSVPLVKEVVEGLEQWVTRLPAANETGKSLQYYAEFSFPEAGYIQRYPTAGTIGLFTPANFISIELPDENPVEPGDKVYKLYWGFGPNSVHAIVSGHISMGPSALDVASDGRIALLNSVNNRVLIYDPQQEAYSSFPLPFSFGYPDQADLAFDQDDQLIVCDFDGQRAEKILRNIPYCYRLLSDGTIDASVPMYAHSPVKLTEDLKVLDRYDYKLILPFDAQWEPNSREAQRQKQTWELPHRLVLGPDGSLDWRTARFADIREGLAFEVHSDFGLGTLDGFEKTPQGYLMLFRSGAEQVRAVWVNPAGLVLKDITLPHGQYTVVPGGQAAVARDGSLYLMSSTENGLEIHVAEAP